MSVESFQFFVFYSENFSVSKGSPFNFFLKFCDRMDVKKSQRPPFTVFGIVRFFKRNDFVLKLGFPRPSKLYPIFVFLRPFFLCDFSQNLFSSKPPSIFTRNETFCEHKGLLGVLGTIRLTGDHQKKFLNFFERFSCEKDGFRALCIPPGIFWRCKIDEILTMSF